MYFMQNLSKEYLELEKLILSFKHNKIKDTLFLCNNARAKYPRLNEISSFHNLLGLINLKLKDYSKSEINFLEAIKIRKDFSEAYFNLSLIYFNNGNLEKSYNALNKAYILKKNYSNARDKMIELLTFYTPKQSDKNIFSLINDDLKKIPFNFNFKKNILDSEVQEYFNKCKSIVSSKVRYFTYNKLEIFKRKKTFLNCSRHKDIFNKEKIIPKFCFDCFKVVITTKNVFDLIKLSFLFEQSNSYSKFNRKTMIDTRSGKKSFKGFIYCSNTNDVIFLENKIREELKLLIDKNIKVESKRGCSEFASSFSNYKNIHNDKSKMMQYPQHWKQKEIDYDNETFVQNNKQENIIVDNFLGISLHNFLIINNWIKFN